MDDFKSFVNKLDKALQPDKSFDLIKRELVIAERCSYLYFIDGFIKDEVFEKMLEFLFKQKPEDIAPITDMRQFSWVKMPYVEVDYTYEAEKAATQVLSGPAVLVVDGVAGALIIDTRTYPTRSIEEPQKDKSLRGSRDGFVETLIFNTAMVRRRIRTGALRMEYLQIGTRSKVDIAISYIDGLADKKTLKILKERLSQIRINGISMTQQAFIEALIPTNFFNPYPRFKFTERPDYASACILDGKIVVIMDNCPAVMIIPTSFADFFRDVDDYYFMPVVGSYTRIIRTVVTLLTVFIVPLYLIAAKQPELMPECLSFMMPGESAALSLFWQFLILEFVVDGLQLASLNTPDTLSNSLGIIGGLLLSEFAVNAGWFIAEAILFMAFVTIASFSQPSIEMSYAMKFQRVFLLILSELFGIWGFFAGTAIIIMTLGFSKTLSGRGYLFPLVPFNWKAFKKLFVRPGIDNTH